MPDAIASGRRAEKESQGQHARIRIGTQGWNYDAWVGPFYPPGTRSLDFLSVYARAFDTVEVDSTCYATPAAAPASAIKCPIGKSRS